jgi:alkylation response protein AidB-like acyl-CoA dehydrogenase
MDMSLPPADIAFQQEVREFLAANLPDHIREGARRSPGVFVEPDIGSEWQQILHHKGWLAAHWPIEDGGTGWTPTQRYLFEKECASAGAPSLSVLALKLVGPVICRFGTAEQKARFLPRILSGEDNWCQGYSEPGSGSDLASLKTRAVRDGNDYRVTGSKLWTTHAHFANWIFTLVRTDTETRPQSGISFLLVPMDQPGVSVTPILTLAGDHEVNAVFFDEAVSSVENRIGDEGQGWTIAKFLLENERGGSCYAPRLLVALDRLRLASAEVGSGINGVMAHDQAFVLRLARLRLEVEALEAMELRILADISNGRPPGPQTSVVKLIASGLTQSIDALAMDLYGYDGLQLPSERPIYGNEAPEPVGSRDAQMVAAKYLNARAWTIFGGTDEVQKNIIAKTVLGL